jgi:hypothetical protein
MSSKPTPRREVPERVLRRLERRSSNAAGTHRTIKHQPRGGRQGARNAVRREVWV